MKKFRSKITTALYFLRYLVTSRHWKGHGVHSPFVFDFLSNVLFDKKIFPEYGFFEKITSSLKASDKRIQVHDLGDESVKLREGSRRISDLVKVSSIPAKYGRLLFRLARYYKPDSIIELGTSIGISSLYLAKGNPRSKILSVEGNKDLCDFAERLFDENEIKNIHIMNKDFDDALNKLSDKFDKPQMVFIDGDHKYESSIDYFTFFKRKMKEGIIVIDDIYWSAGMRKAWKEIIGHSQDYVTMDIFRMGIVIIRESVTPGHYLIRF